MLGGGMGDFAGRDSNAIDVESWGGPDQDVSVDAGSIGGMMGSPDSDLGGAAAGGAIDVEGWGPADQDVSMSPAAIGGMIDAGPNQARTPDQQYSATIRELMERGLIKKTPSGMLSMEGLPAEDMERLEAAFRATKMHNFRDTVKQAAGRLAGHLTSTAVGMGFGTVAAAAAPAALATIEGQISSQLAQKALGGFVGGKVSDMARQGVLESSASRALGVPEALADQRVNAHYAGMAPQETPASRGVDVSPNQSQAGQLAAARAASVAPQTVDTTPAVAAAVPQSYPNRYSNADLSRKARLSGRQSVVNQLTNARTRL